jgi:hypothetical protein
VGKAGRAWWKNALASNFTVAWPVTRQRSGDEQFHHRMDGDETTLGRRVVYLTTRAGSRRFHLHPAGRDFVTNII